MAFKMPNVPIGLIASALGSAGTIGTIGWLGYHSIYSGAAQF